MIILVLNCGSSSIKYQVIGMEPTGHTLLAKGLVERIGLSDGVLTHKVPGRDNFERTQAIPDHTIGINLILSAITSPEHGVLRSLDELNAVGHRVAHGGEFFDRSVLVDADVIRKIESCFELAPLHNPANQKGILAIQALLPTLPQVAVFDTSFHQTMPAKSYLYALPYETYEKLRVRRYGFHGTSHKFVAEKACELTGLPFDKSRIITCHIGNGASVTAILNGKSYTTSMGFTPVDGLVMGTRCGEVDPGALLYIAERQNLNFAQLNDLINKQSGVQGITDISSDMRDINDAASSGNERAQLALDIYYERVKKFVGGYAAIMEGVDLLVFTGGVGENEPALRSYVCSGMAFMGIEFDEAANKGTRGQDKVLSTTTSRVKVVVATTDEELVIATDTYHLTK